MFSPKINLPKQTRSTEDNTIYLLVKDVENLSTKVSLTPTALGSKTRADAGDFTTKTVASEVPVYDSFGNVLPEIFADISFQTSKIGSVSNRVGAVKFRAFNKKFLTLSISNDNLDTPSTSYSAINSSHNKEAIGKIVVINEYPVTDKTLETISFKPDDDSVPRWWCGLFSTCG